MKYLFVIILLLIAFSSTYSQMEEPLRNRYAVTGSALMSYHDLEFRQVPGVEYYSPFYEDSKNLSYSFGIFYEIPIFNKKGFFFRPGISYSLHKAELSRIEEAEFVYNGNLEQGNVNYVLNTSFHCLRLEPIIRLEVYKTFAINFGMNLAYIPSATFIRYEELNPHDAVDGESKERFRKDGDIQEFNHIQSGIMGGISYDIPLDNNNIFILSPEIIANYNFTPNFEVINWTTHFLRAGLSLKISPMHNQLKEEIVESFKIDTIIIGSEEILNDKVKIGVVSKSSSTINSDGKQITYITNSRIDTLYKHASQNVNINISADQIIMEEYYSTAMYPLLNYIFFDKESSSIPDRYTKFDGRASAKNFPDDECLNTYLNVLNIIGKRLEENPKAKVSLRAYSANDTIQSISEKRAESVIDYLAGKWNIAKSRFNVETGVYPDNPSNINTPLGLEENRRVEIFSDEPAILAPVIIENSIKTSIKPEEIEVNINSNNLLEKIELNISSNSKYLFLNIFDNKYIIDTKNLEPLISSNKGILNFDFLIKPQVKGRFNITKQLNYNKYTLSEQNRNHIKGKRIDSFRLLLFDFDKSKLKPEHYETLALIRNKLKSSEYNHKAASFKVNIAGYTDLSGSDAYNLSLSEARANETYTSLGIKEAQAKGEGERELYDNKLPEGRFYSRTVEITIESTTND